jgi:DnaJ-like protein/RDD family protein
MPDEGPAVANARILADYSNGIYLRKPPQSMKATLYDALGISPTSSDEDVRAALRGLIRKYYAKTRDGQGNVEEALRFINHASRILGDSERRERYDQELSHSAEDDAPPSPHVVNQALLGDDEHTEAGAATTPGDEAIADPVDSRLRDETSETPPSHHPGLTERVASFSRSPVVTFGLCGVFAVFIGAAIASVTPADIVVVARQVAGWLIGVFAVLAAVYGSVHGLVYMRRRQAGSRSSLTPQTDLAILNWRRERSVFLGASQPQEDASWVFQLRMAELERAKSGRTSEARPWHRLAARMFDYAIWGLVLALLLSQLRALGAVPANVAYWLTHPLLAPMLITASWIPIEALLVTAVGTTPGKWLFGIYLQFSISDAYAIRSTSAQLMRGLKRAFRVWFEGMACGFPLLAPVLVAVAYEKLAANQETDWDFAEDCLVTHGPAGVVNTVTGVCGLASMMWLYGVAWQQPLADSIAWTRSTIADALPSGAAVKGKLTDASAKLDRLLPAMPTIAPFPPPKEVAHAAPVRGAPASGTIPAGAAAASLRADDASAAGKDVEFETLIAARRARIDVLKVEGPRMLKAGNARRAAELCRAWVDLDLANPDAWRCLGRAQQALGLHQDALNSYRKAKQHDPMDRTLDAAIESAQRGIVADFLNRYRR